MSALSVTVTMLSCVLGGFFLAVLAASLRLDRRMMREGIVVSGAVGERLELGDGDFLHRIHFEVSGISHGFLTKNAHLRLVTGQVVRVRYLPDRLREACLDDPRELKSDTRYFVIGGALCWVGALVSCVLGVLGVF